MGFEREVGLHGLKLGALDRVSVPKCQQHKDYSLLWDYFKIIQEVDYPRTPYSSLEMVRRDYRIICMII